MLSPDAATVLIDNEQIGSLEGPRAGHAVLGTFLGECAPEKLREDLLRPLAPHGDAVEARILIFDESGK